MRTLLNRTTYFGLGILLALFLVASETKAQCPTDIPVPRADSGNTATAWTVGGSYYVYNIPGTDCFIDIFYCQRFILNIYGITIETQYSVFKVQYDLSLSGSGACDGISPDVLITDGVAGMFQKFDAPPCNGQSKLVTVFRRTCWSLDPNSYFKFNNCGSSPNCGKTCYVCYNSSTGENTTTGCIYTLYGNTPDCENGVVSWVPSVCYYIPCGQ